MPESEQQPRRDLRSSILLIGAVVTIALIGLAFDGNWPKVARVGLSFLAYAGCLLLWLRLSRAIGHRRTLPFYSFASAGAFAGIVSGLVRPQFHLETLLAGAAAAALLLGGVHWLALANWRNVRAAVTAGR